MRNLIAYFMCVALAVTITTTGCKKHECPEPEECEVCKNHKCPDPEECEICKNHKCPEPVDYLLYVSNFTFDSGDYFGDENEDGIARYTMVMSVDYEAKEITRAPELIKANDVFYLTLFSDVALDAEYALPEPGRYTVASEKGSLTLLAGKSKVSDAEYEGSYVVSTVDGVVRESKITGGALSVSDVNGKRVFKFEFEDEAGVMSKYSDVELLYTFNDKKSFANESGIEYHVFRNPGDDYNRNWYWGTPLNSVRESEDGYPLGEYQFVFSNAKDGDLMKEGQVSTTFNLMDEFQLYGLDRIIFPGVYPVNQASYRGVLGTIFKDDLTHSSAPYRGTATVKLFEDGAAVRYFVEDGWFAIFGDENNVPNRYIVQFILENGEVFHGRYDGALTIGDEWTYSPFREDITQNNLTSSFMRIKDPDYFYKQAGSNHWELYLLGEGVSVSFDEYGYSNIKGPGDCFVFEMSTEASATDALPAGTYDIKDSYEPWVAQYGNKSIAYIGIYMGAWFHRLSRTADPLSTMGLNGTVTISVSGSEYTVDVTMHDDAKNTIKGKYVGTPTIEDHRTPEGSPARPRTYVERTTQDKFAGESTAYMDAYKMRIENAQKQLK